jgi:hypothetical protein
VSSLQPRPGHWLLRCPLCKSGFTAAAGALVCRNGHSFDLAREGYVNLLSGRSRRPAAGGEGPNADAIGMRPTKAERVCMDSPLEEDGVIDLPMALLSFADFSTPSLLAQGGQRLPRIFNIDRGIPP